MEKKTTNMIQQSIIADKQHKLFMKKLIKGLKKDKNIEFAIVQDSIIIKQLIT